MQHLRVFKYASVFQCSSVSCRQIHVGSYVCQKTAKRTWSAKAVNQLRTWKQDTDEIFGPPLVTTNGKEAKRKRTAKAETRSLPQLDSFNDFVESDGDGDAIYSESYMSVLDSPDSTGPEERLDVFGDVKKHVKTCTKGSRKPAKSCEQQSSQLNDIAQRVSTAAKVYSETENTCDYQWVDSTKDTINIVHDPSTSSASPPSNASKTVGDSNPSNSIDDFIRTFPLFIVESRMQTPQHDIISPGGRLPSVTKILSATQSEESRQALERWERQMIAELGQDGFSKYKTGGVLTSIAFSLLFVSHSRF